MSGSVENSQSSRDDLPSIFEMSAWFIVSMTAYISAAYSLSAKSASCSSAARPSPPVGSRIDRSMSCCAAHPARPSE